MGNWPRDLFRHIRMTPNRGAGALAALVVAGVMLGACGSGGNDSGSNAATTTTITPKAGWVSQELRGSPGPDHPTLLAVDGERVALTMVSDEGVITGFSSDRQGRFRAGESTATGIKFLGFGGVTRAGDGWLAMGSGGLAEVEGDKQPVFEVHAFRSADGRTWRDASATGLDGPADVSGLTGDGRGFVAVGTQRNAKDPAQGGFRPVAWHSADGQRWTAVRLPDDGATEGSVQAVVATSDRVLAVGRVGQRGIMWSSADGGASWTIVTPEGIPTTSSLDDIDRQGDELVLSGTTPAARRSESEARQLLLRSTDAGHSWLGVTHPPPPNRGEPAAFPLFAGGGRFFALGTSFIEAFANPELCYADVNLCRQDSAVALYVSEDGDRWSRVDTSGIGEGDAGEVDGITATDDGRAVAIQRTAAGIRAWSWPAHVPLPTEREPALPRAGVHLLGEKGVPEQGRRYAVPLYIHCGMEWLYVGGRAWHRTDSGPGPETGAGSPVPEDWPVAQQTIFGYVTLVSPGRIEYSIGQGKVIATYAPATDRPPGCD